MPDLTIDGITFKTLNGFSFKDMIMKSLCYSAMFLSILLVSCSTHPSEQPTRTLLATTQFVYPTVTTGASPVNTPTHPTPVLTPWSKLIPEPLIFIPGDLPSSYEILAVDHKIPKASLLYGASLRATVAKTSIEIIDSAQPEISYVVLLLYDSLSQRDLAMGGAFLNIMWGASEVTELENIGEKGWLLTREKEGIESVIFTRCNALVYMEIRGEALDYAQKLDERLSPFICPSATDGEAGPF